MGEAYFEAMAERFEAGDHREAMRLLARVERRAAAHVRPLVARHGLTLRDEAELRALGKAEAAAETGEWEALLAGMRRTYPGYVEDFRRLEAMAPEADRAPLARLTEHETAALDFLDREAAGTPDPTAPLRAYVAA